MWGAGSGERVGEVKLEKKKRKIKKKIGSQQSRFYYPFI